MLGQADRYEPVSLLQVVLVDMHLPIASFAKHTRIVIVLIAVFVGAKAAWVVLCISNVNLITFDAVVEDVGDVWLAALSVTDDATEVTET